MASEDYHSLGVRERLQVGHRGNHCGCEGGLAVRSEITRRLQDAVPATDAERHEHTALVVLAALAAEIPQRQVLFRVEVAGLERIHRGRQLRGSIVERAGHPGRRVENNLLIHDRGRNVQPLHQPGYRSSREGHCDRGGGIPLAVRRRRYDRRTWRTGLERFGNCGDEPVDPAMAAAPPPDEIDGLLLAETKRHGDLVNFGSR